MNSEIVHKLNDMTKELTSKIDNSESRLFSKLELELKPLVNQTFEKILDSTYLNLSHQKMDYMIQQIQSMGNEVKALDSRLEKQESKLESFTHENEKLKESSRINSDKAMETENSATSVSESDTTDDSSILELDETDRIQVSDKVVMFSRQKLTKHNNVYEGEISSGLLGIRRCAIKLPRESSQRDEEIIILGKLGSHSHVNCIIQSGVFDDGMIKRRFLVLELCYRENLDQFLRNRPYHLQQRLEYCTQIINGMNYVHKKKIIHKDLKPANILLSLDLQCIKIADFGISQEIQSERSMVYCENSFGTIGYHPPESFGNDYISLKSDIFSLGVLFHFVMNKEESPFGSASDLWDSNIKKGNVDINLQFVPNPIAFAHLFKLMMRKDRRWRPTIRQVQKHPCWTLQEEDCYFHYGFMDEVDLGSAKRDSSQLEDVDSIDDHVRLMEMLSILDPIEKEMKKKKSKFTTLTGGQRVAQTRSFGHFGGHEGVKVPHREPWQEFTTMTGEQRVAQTRSLGHIGRHEGVIVSQGALRQGSATLPEGVNDNLSVTGNTVNLRPRDLFKELFGGSQLPPQQGRFHIPVTSQYSQPKQTYEEFMPTLDADAAGIQKRWSQQRSQHPASGSDRPKQTANPKPSLSRCKALHDYAAQDTDEFSFSADDVFEVIKEDPSGWWTGLYRGREGLFPGNYVEKI